MQKIVAGRLYDTQTAQKLVSVTDSLTGPQYSSPQYYKETLYKTKKGRYFIAGHGGPQSHWNLPRPYWDDTLYYGSRSIVLPDDDIPDHSNDDIKIFQCEDDVKLWLEKVANASYNRFFSTEVA